MSEIIYEKVICLMNEQNLTKHQLENLANLGNGTIEGWKNHAPNISSIVKVAKVLNISVEELLKT